jgi:uncharacterized protein (UPF0332 family)
VTSEQAREEVIAFWLARSDEAVASARAELDAGRRAFAVNRAYYACFYALSAVLLADGRKYVKHSGVRSALHRQLIRSGRLDASWGRFYDRVFENRHRGDYQELVVFEDAHVRELCEQAAGFVTQMRRLLEPASAT